MNKLKIFNNPIFILFLFSMCSFYTCPAMDSNNRNWVHVGVILNLNSKMGKVAQSCILMAASHFNESLDGNRSSNLVLHFRDSHGDVLKAASAALDLIKNVGVQTIIGPETSKEADFLAYMGNEAHIPIVSFSAISSSLSPVQFPYLVRVAQNVSSQVKAIAAIVQAYGWTEVSLVYEESQSGTSILPYLMDVLDEIDVEIRSRISLPSIANSAVMKDTVAKLNATGAKVIVVHLSFSLSAQFFLRVKENGMMRTGYAWIVTCGITDLLGYMDPLVLHHMEGVIGVRTHMPPSKALRNFTDQWVRKFRDQHFKIRELSIYALWAYDTTYIMALAANKAGLLHANNNKIAKNIMDPFDMGVSLLGSELLHSMLSTNFSGLSGKIQLVDGQLQSNTFEVINVRKKRGDRIGYWTPGFGLSQTLDDLENYFSGKDLGPAIWPGGSKSVPSIARIFKVGVPVKTGFLEFVNVSYHPKDNSSKVTGFSKEVFDGVMKALPYHYKYVPFEIDHGAAAGDYNDLIYQVYLKKFDAVLGDVTILPNRSRYVDFTQPYSVSGFRMIVPIKDDDFTQSPWWFLKPLTTDLWLITIACFCLKGILVWIFEHQINPEFQGTFSQQVGKMLSYSFSIFVFAHREKLESNYSRFIVNMWTFAVFILVTSYTANLTSMLAVDNLKPTVTDLDVLLREGKSVGYQSGSFVYEFLRDRGFADTQLIQLSTAQDYASAMSNGSSNGGVSAVVDELPYINIFLSNYCQQYTVIGPTYPSGGFGFVFPKGSPLVSAVSKAVLFFTEGNQMKTIENRWFGSQICPDPLLTKGTSKKMHLYSFRSIYEILAVVSSIAVLVFLVSFTCKHVRNGNFIENLKNACNKRWYRNRKSKQDMDTKNTEGSAIVEKLESAAESANNEQEELEGRARNHQDPFAREGEQARGKTKYVESNSNDIHLEIIRLDKRSNFGGDSNGIKTRQVTVGSLRSCCWP